MWWTVCIWCIYLYIVHMPHTGGKSVWWIVFIYLYIVYMPYSEGYMSVPSCIWSVGVFTSDRLTIFYSDDGFRSGCRNVSQHQQQSFAGLHYKPGQSLKPQHIHYIQDDTDMYPSKYGIYTIYRLGIYTIYMTILTRTPLYMAYQGRRSGPNSGGGGEAGGGSSCV